jgi:hypothetical protein
MLASRADWAAARGLSTCWASRTAFCSFVWAARSSGSSGWVIAIRESMVGVSDATDSGGPGISVDLEGSSADGVGGFGRANLGGGVGGVNYMSVTLREEILVLGGSWN